MRGAAGVVRACRVGSGCLGVGLVPAACEVRMDAGRWAVLCAAPRAGNVPGAVCSAAFSVPRSAGLHHRPPSGGDRPLGASALKRYFCARRSLMMSSSAEITSSRSTRDLVNFN